MTALSVPSNSSIHTLKTYINRDLSLLEFHKRVLAQAKDTEYQRWSHMFEQLKAYL